MVSAEFRAIFGLVSTWQYISNSPAIIILYDVTNEYNENVRCCLMVLLVETRIFYEIHV